MLNCWMNTTKDTPPALISIFPLSLHHSIPQKHRICSNEDLTEVGGLLGVDLVVGERLPLRRLRVLLLLDGVVQGHHLGVLPPDMVIVVIATVYFHKQ